MHEATKSSCIRRLNRIEGQVRGLARMVEDSRYCIDIVTQVSAVRAALRRVEQEVCAIISATVCARPCRARMRGPSTGQSKSSWMSWHGRRANAPKQAHDLCVCVPTLSCACQLLRRCAC